jgi:hypothetical protein
MMSCISRSPRKSDKGGESRSVSSIKKVFDRCGHFRYCPRTTAPERFGCAETKRVVAPSIQTGEAITCARGDRIEQRNAIRNARCTTHYRFMVAVERAGDLDGFRCIEHGCAEETLVSKLLSEPRPAAPKESDESR